MNKISLLSLTMSFISLMAFWIIMSGFFDLIHLGFGIATVVGVMAVNYKLKAHRFFDDDMDDLKDLRFFQFFLYIIWLIYQIIIAGFHVLSIILSPRMPIETTILKFRVDLPSSHAKMILGNSITLTPGTLTVDIQGDQFIVHAIDSKSYEAIASDEMPGKVYQLFEKEKKQVVKELEIIKSTEAA